MTLDTEIVGLEQVFPDSYTQSITLIAMYCFELKKNVVYEALNIVKDFVNNQLRDNYNHLKRCKKTNDTVEILIGFCDKIPNELLNELMDINKEEIKIKEVHVSKYPPMTRKQYSEWSKFWPIYYRKPAYDCSTLTKEEIKKYINFINTSIRIGKEFGTCQSGCVLAYNDKIVACSGDNIKNHPLQHSFMLAIEEVSYKLRHISQIKNMLNNKNHEEDHIDENTLSEVIVEFSKNKNNNLKLCKEKNNSNNAFKKLGLNEKENMNCDQKNLEKKENEILQKNLNIYKPINIDQYLCTNYFAFLSHEPCYMCAMAMVHSRIKCVVFDKVNKENGALYSKEKIHCIKNLNHHFKVYKTIRKNT